MTIPTRDELIERAISRWNKTHWMAFDERERILADFALSEIRRAVIAELEALRATRVLLPAIDMKDPYALGRHDEELTWANEIERRLAALRAEQNEQPPVAQRTGASCAPSEPVHARSDLGQNLERAGSTPAPGATCCDRAAQEMEAKMDEELRAVRMEAQALREANASWDFTCQKLIGWIQWRQAWTGGNDPRDLSGTRWDICALRGDAPPRGFMGCMPPPTTAKAGASERERLRDESPAGNVAAPALSDADRLRAALNENHERYMELPQWARDAIGVPFGSSAPKQVDVFEAFAQHANTSTKDTRDWFGPLVEALEAIRDGNAMYPHAVAEGALSALRRKAEEAGRG